MQNKPIPTEKEELAMYRQFLHDLNSYAAIAMDEQAVGDLIENACDWSYAHRVGNGVPTEEEQDQIVANRFWKLRDITPDKERHDQMMQNTRNQLRNSEIEHVARDLLNSVMEKYKVESVDNLTCPIMRRLFTAIRGTDDQVGDQVSDRIFKRQPNE